MSDQTKPVSQNQKPSESASNSRQTIKFLAALAIGAMLLILSGITLTGTVVSLIIVSPILVLFSPILVPAGIVIFLAATGLLFSGGFGVAALTALSWIYDYVAGKNPPGSDRVDYARMRLANKAKKYEQYVQNKAQEVNQGS